MRLLKIIMTIYLITIVIHNLFITIINYQIHDINPQIFNNFRRTIKSFGKLEFIIIH